MSAFGMNPTFNEPPSDDTSSAPQMPQAPQVQPPTTAPKKKKGFGPNVRNSGALMGAISRAKRARQSGDKWGA